MTVAHLSCSLLINAPNACEVFAAGCRPYAQHILHYEDLRFEKRNILQKLLVKMAAFVFDDTAAVVGPVRLTHCAESLTGWSAHDHIHRISAYFFGKLLGP